MVVSVRTLLGRGDQTFAAIGGKLPCSACGRKPAPVYLVAGLTRQACNGLWSWSAPLLQRTVSDFWHGPTIRNRREPYPFLPGSYFPAHPGRHACPLHLQARTYGEQLLTFETKQEQIITPSQAQCNEACQCAN